MRFRKGKDEVLCMCVYVHGHMCAHVCMCLCICSKVVVIRTVFLEEVVHRTDLKVDKVIARGIYIWRKSEVKTCSLSLIHI